MELSLESSRLFSLPLELRRKIWGYVIGRGVHFEGQLHERMPIEPEETRAMGFKIYRCQDKYLHDHRLGPNDHGICRVSPGKRPFSFNWMMASSDIYGEAMGVLWAEALLCFHDARSFQSLIWKLRPGGWDKMIRSIHIEWGDSSLKFEQTIFTWNVEGDLPYLPGLHNISVHIRLMYLTPEDHEYLKRSARGDSQTLFRDSLMPFRIYEPRTVTAAMRAPCTKVTFDEGGEPHFWPHLLTAEEVECLRYSLQSYLLSPDRQYLVSKAAATRMRQAAVEGKPLLSALEDW